MQVKKDEVKKAILESGQREFLEKGYEKASIRKIVKLAGTTIGNFYNYFKNKEALFDALVSQDYHQFMYFVKHHNDVERPDYLWEVPNPSLWRKILAELMDEMIPHFGIGFLLVIDCSEGTSYAGTKEAIIALVKEHFIEHLEKLGNHHIPHDFAELIAIQLVEGLVLILRKYPDPKVCREHLINYILFYMVGTMGLIGNM